MKVFLKSRIGKFDASGEYNEETNQLVLFKGSKISGSVSGGKFRSANFVEKLRNTDRVRDGIVIESITFKSPSAAANFVTGTSTNGMLAWKDENGNSLKNL